MVINNELGRMWKETVKLLQKPGGTEKYHREYQLVPAKIKNLAPPTYKSETLLLHCSMELVI
jgi:hypothetical protein